MESEEIRNRISNWEPMIHSDSNDSTQNDSNNYYKSNNQYNYGRLFSTTITKSFQEQTIETVEKPDPCELCRTINHSSKDSMSSKLKYANRERLTGMQAVRFTNICNFEN